MTITLNGTSGVTTPGVTNTGNETISGTLTAGSFNAASTFGFKNRLINGNISTDQRNAGASQTFTAGAALAYCVDRWYGYCTGANVTGQQIAGAYTSSQYRYQFTGAASVTAIGFGQRIEAKNSFDLANTTATLSCYISNSLLTTVTWTAYYANSTDTFGTLASPTRTQISTGTFTVSSTRTQYTTSISIPSAATTGIEIVFTVGAQTSGTWIIDSIQLEPGSVATTFDYRPYGTEFDLCRRYCEVYSGSADADGIPQYPGPVDVNNRPEIFVTYYTKRAAPSITVTNAATAFQINTMANTVLATTAYNGTSVGTGLNSSDLFWTVASGMTTNTLSGISVLSFKASGKIIIDSEL